MKTAVLILAPGFEEIEALATVDILRRANIKCDIIGFTDAVEGSHGIVVQADAELGPEIMEADMIIFPGGATGAKHLRENPYVITMLQQMAERGKYIAAICAAPTVLARAGLLEGKKYTAYPGFEAEITQGEYQAENVVIDGNIITSRGPATVFDFAYTLVDILGGDAAPVKEGMLYQLYGGK